MHSWVKGNSSLLKEAPHLFSSGDYYEIVKYIDKIKESSPEPLGQFQPNLAQRILGLRKFKFVHMKKTVLLQMGNNFENTNMRKFDYFRKKKCTFSFFYNCVVLMNVLKVVACFFRTTEPISTKLGKKHSYLKRIQIWSNEGPRLFLRGDNYKIAKFHKQNLKSFFYNC